MSTSTSKSFLLSAIGALGLECSSVQVVEVKPLCNVALLKSAGADHWAKYAEELESEIVAAGDDSDSPVPVIDAAEAEQTVDDEVFANKLIKHDVEILAANMPQRSRSIVSEDIADSDLLQRLRPETAAGERQDIHLHVITILFVSNCASWTPGACCWC